MRVDAYPGCRLTPFALPWAMYSLGFQPVSVMRCVYSLKGIKSIAQRQATLGAAPWVDDEGCCAL